jgi:hypothetical protein
MCCGCWEEEGAPVIKTPKVSELADALAAADPYGPLHIAVDDCNLDFDSVEWCRFHDDAKPWDDWSPEDRRCWILLTAATEAERYSAAGLNHGCWS